MARKDHNLEDEYHCIGLQETRVAVESLVDWQKRQNGSLERLENTLSDIRDTLLGDAKIAVTTAGRASKLTMVVAGLVLVDLVIHLGPEIAGKVVRAVLGLP